MGPKIIRIRFASLTSLFLVFLGILPPSPISRTSCHQKGQRANPEDSQPRGTGGAARACPQAHACEHLSLPEASSAGTSPGAVAFLSGLFHSPLTVLALNPSQPQEKVSITAFSWGEEW